MSPNSCQKCKYAILSQLLKPLKDPLIYETVSMVVSKKIPKQTKILLLWMLKFEIKSVILLLLKAGTLKLKSQGMIDPRRENSFKIEKFPKSM